MGTLMPIWPASISVWNLRAALPDFVKMAAPLPQAFLLMKSMADCRSGLCTTTRTGPKISSLYTVWSLCTLVMMVGPMKLPLLYLGCL